VGPEAIDAGQWEWRKNYRVWQANRKVFLYPENWIDPTLRDDRTPFFKDLQTELQQGEVTGERAETAFRNYLTKLLEVSRLEICGFFVENDSDARYKRKNDHAQRVSRFRTHVRNSPHLLLPQIKHHHRYLSPWERVDADIQGDTWIRTMDQVVSLDVGVNRSQGDQISVVMFNLR